MSLSTRIAAVLESPLSLKYIQSKTSLIFERVLAESKHLDAPNFTVIHSDDLNRLFAHYDREFFENSLGNNVGSGRLSFRLSKRMTSAGGTTTRRRRRGGGDARYEIAISTTLLFQTFHDESRPIEVAGLVCNNRLESLQRVFEHELVHLVEMLIWDDSACAKPRFQNVARCLFGHTHHRHALITPRERAFTKFGLRTGMKVRFEFEGKQYEGVVNRITKRATVLVEHPQGQPYNDGKKYRKFYAPIEMLQVVEE